ncbi:MAG: flavin-containing monooxygenase FMO [Benjaminiella poitrasii]|nr:MAG: flavin-containing monooxygenase FMO [Benjaminiella poitrasii]
MGENQELPTVAIIGAGFSGLCTAIQLNKQLGIKAQIYEVSSDVGGTWHDNTYPGCACDIPSPLYSFSFELNPNWSYHYSSQKEIYAYLRNVAKKYNIYEQTRFKTEVLHMKWIEDRQMWEIQSHNVAEDNAEVTVEYYNYVIAGLGPLRIPSIPSQLKNFKGTTVHTAMWDSSIDFTNKNVAVVGSGASAIQAIPELRKVCKHLISYQRTPAWIAPRDQFKYSRFSKFILKHVPFLMRIFRNAIFFQHEFYYFYFGYNGSFVSRLIHRLFEKLTAYRLKKAGRPDLVPILTPNFPPGCKRVAKSENYLEALAKPNVTVIPRAVKETRENVIVDTEGNEQEVDILVLATGFDVHGFLGNLHIYGRNGLDLRDKWENNFPSMYKATSIHGFPNFFLLLGPGAGLGHNSVVIMIEAQVQYAIKCIKYAMRNNLAAMEPKLDAQSAYTSHIKKQFTGTVWKTGCSSWYLKNGEVYGLWPGTVTSFWWSTAIRPGLHNFIQHKKGLTN